MKHLMQSSCAALMAACLALPALAQDSTTTTTPPPAGGASGGTGSTLDANTGSESGTATGSESTTSTTGTASGAGSAPSDMSGTGAAASTEASGNATTDAGGSPGAAGSVAGGGALNNGDSTARQGTGQGATQASGQAANYGSVISGLQSGTTMTEQVSGISENTRIEVMPLSEMHEAGAEQQESLDQALEAGGETVAQMREQLSQNDRVTQALEAENHSIDDVIGIHEGNDGTIQLIVDDRSAL